MKYNITFIFSLNLAPIIYKILVLKVYKYLFFFNTAFIVIIFLTK